MRIRKHKKIARANRSGGSGRDSAIIEQIPSRSRNGGIVPHGAGAVKIDGRNVDLSTVRFDRVQMTYTYKPSFNDC